MVPGVLTFYLMLAVLTPLVHRIVGWSLERSGSALGLIGHHLVVLPVFVVLHLTATMIIQRQIVPHEPDLGVHFTNMIRIFSMGSAVWYVVIAASLHALLYNLRSQDNELAAARLAARLAEARLSALGAQLGSHFLFNTLSTIGALAERGEAGEVTEVVHDLSDLLRELRQDGVGSTTSVAHEERLLAKYLRILHLRFGSRLSASVDIEARVRNAEIPLLTLQILAENAVKHGYGTQTTGLEVEVRVERAQDQLRICVTDSGPGFSAKGLRSGGGLSNLKARLRALYRQDFSLETSTSSLGGARVEVCIPYRPSDASRSRVD
jgi:LytS/YehU family sensor histidine kinase